MKQIYKNKMNEQDYKNLINEGENLKKFDHPNILRIYEYYNE